MKNFLFSKECTNFMVRYRAVCEDDKFKGDWRASVDEAKDDAAEHRKKPGNRDHVINIIVEQSIKMAYQD